MTNLLKYFFWEKAENECTNQLGDGNTRDAVMENTKSDSSNLSEHIQFNYLKREG